MGSRDLRFRFGALDRSGLILGLRAGQAAIVGVGVGLMVVSLVLGHGFGGVIAAAVVLTITAGSTFAPVAGRGVDEWIPVLVRWFGGGAREWTSHLPRIGHRARSTRAGTAVAATDAVLPPSLRGVTLLAVRVGTGELGVVKDMAQGTYTAVLRVRGGSYALMADSEKARALGGWGGILAAFAHHGSVVSRLQVVIRTVAEDPDGMARYFQEQRLVHLDSPILRSYISLVDEAAPVTQAQEAYVALAIGMRQSSRAIKQAGGGDDGAVTVLVRQLQLLQSQLERADVRVEGALTSRLLAQVLREAWEPSATFDLRRRGSGAASDGVDLSGAGPQATRARWTHYETDGGACHATYWISEWPRVSVSADFLVPLLLQSQAKMTFGITMAPVDPSRAQREIETAQTSRLADESLREKHGFRTSARTTREQQAIENREQELADGHAEYRFSGYITITAPDVKELTTACGEVEQQARNSHLDVRRLDGDHDRAFTYTLPLCRGVR